VFEPRHHSWDSKEIPEDHPLPMTFLLTVIIKIGILILDFGGRLGLSTMSSLFVGSLLTNLFDQPLGRQLVARR
jgi:hypothetical protein